MLNELKFEIENNENESEVLNNKEELLKRLYVGFANKQKLENLRFFII